MNPQTRTAASKATRTTLVRAARELRKRQTKSEQMLWMALRNRKLEGRKFRRQTRIAHFIVDFYCADEQMVVEIDGGVHRILQAEDENRNAVLQGLGLRVVRVSAEDVESNPPNVLELIRRAFRSPGPRATTHA